MCIRDRVWALGSNPAYTNTMGYFELTFTQLAPGDVVQYLEVTKDGFAVINDEILQNVIVPSDLSRAPLRITMAKSREFRTQKANYYQIIVDNANTRFEKDLQEINAKMDKLNNDDKERAILLKQISELNKEKDQLIKQAQDLAEKLASVDLDVASKLANEAYQEFEKGNVEKAISILNDDALEQNYMVAFGEKVKAEKRLEEAKEALEQSIDNYMLKARFCIADNKYVEAMEAYEKAVSRDSLDVNNLLEFARFLFTQGKRERSIEYYNEALSEAGSIGLQADILYKRSRVYSSLRRYEKAEKDLKKSLTYNMSMIGVDSVAQFKKISRDWTALGQTYFKLKDYEQSEKAYIKGVNTAAPDDISVIARNYDYFGQLYTGSKEVEKADSFYNLALVLRTQLVETDSSEENLKLLGYLYNNRAIFYRKTGQLDRVEDTYKNAIQIWEVLSRVNHSKWHNGLGFLNIQLAGYYEKVDSMLLAEEAFLKAYKIYEDLILVNPLKYQPQYISINSHLSHHYDKRNDRVRAMERYRIMNESMVKYFKIDHDLGSVRLNGQVVVEYADFLVQDSLYSEAFLALEGAIQQFEKIEVKEENAKRYYHYLAPLLVKYVELRDTQFQSTQKVEVLDKGITFIQKYEATLSHEYFPEKRKEIIVSLQNGFNELKGAKE